MKKDSWIDKVSSVFNSVESAWKRAPAPSQLYPVQSTPSYLPLTFPGWDVLEKRNSRDDEDEQRARLATTSPWVYSDILAIANEASVSKLKVMRRTDAAEGQNEIENHPLELLWEAPNPFMGRSFLVSFWIWQRLLSGKAFLFWVTSPSGIAEVWPVPSFMMKPVAHPQKFISAYAFQPTQNDKPILIDSKYITYSRIPHPFDARDGLSPLVAIFTEIESDLFMAKWNKSYFGKENAMPTGVLGIKDVMEFDLEVVRRELQDFFGNGTKRVAVAKAGDMTWTPFDRSHKDMEFLNGRNFSRSAIDRVFGIPEGYWSKDATRANSEGAKATMIENAVWPHLVSLAEDLNAQLLPHWYNKDLRIEFEDIRPRSRALELEEFTAYQTVKTIDELRSMIGDAPIGDERGKKLVAEITSSGFGDVKDSKQGGGSDSGSNNDFNNIEEVEENENETENEEEQEEEIEDGSKIHDEHVLDALVSESVEIIDNNIDVDKVKWLRKALKSFKSGKSANVKFESTLIPEDEQERIRTALTDAKDADAVRDAFKHLPGGHNQSSHGRRRGGRSGRSGGGSGDTDQSNGVVIQSIRGNDRGESKMIMSNPDLSYTQDAVKSDFGNNDKSIRLAENQSNNFYYESNAEQRFIRDYQEVNESSLDSDQNNALADYQGSGYSYINRTLWMSERRDDGSIDFGDESNTTINHLRHLQDAVSSHSAPFDIVTTRSQNMSHPLYELMNNAEIGSTYTSLGYDSSQLDTSNNWSGGDIRVDYLVPKGAKGVYLNGINDYYSEYPKEIEWLHPANSSWTIIAKTKDDDGRIRVALELVDQRDFDGNVIYP